MADKLKGTWVFDKCTFGAINNFPDNGMKDWNVDFTSNGRLFHRLRIAAYDFANGIYDTNSISLLVYSPDIYDGGSDYVIVYRPDYAYRTEYFTIQIQSTYDDVENAETLYKALSARATFTPSTGDITKPDDDNTTPGEDINILMESAKGVRLKTAGKRCKSDIVVTPAFDSETNLQDKTVTENGTYTADDGYDGLGTVSVNVPSKEPNIQPLTITENGTYTAEDGVDGYSPITVEVAASGGGEEEQLYRYISGETMELSFPALTKLRNYAFTGGGVTAISIPNVTEIGNYAFGRDSSSTNSSLESVLMPKVETIGSYAFCGCRELALLSLPDSINTIKAYAFYKCYAVKITEFPASLSTIEGNAFYNCSGLKELTFKGTPTSIASTVFKSCPSITAINVPWAEGAVANAPWGATTATINYNYTGG